MTVPGKVLLYLFETGVLSSRLPDAESSEVDLLLGTPESRPRACRLAAGARDGDTTSVKFKGYVIQLYDSPIDLIGMKGYIVAWQVSRIIPHIGRSSLKFKG